MEYSEEAKKVGEYLNRVAAQVESSFRQRTELSSGSRPDHDTIWNEACRLGKIEIDGEQSAELVNALSSILGESNVSLVKAWLAKLAARYVLEKSVFDRCVNPCAYVDGLFSEHPAGPRTLVPRLYADEFLKAHRTGTVPVRCWAVLEGLGGLNSFVPWRFRHGADIYTISKITNDSIEADDLMWGNSGVGKVGGQPVVDCLVELHSWVKVDRLGLPDSKSQWQLREKLRNVAAALVLSGHDVVRLGAIWIDPTVPCRGWCWRMLGEPDQVFANGERQDDYQGKKRPLSDLDRQNIERILSALLGNNEQDIESAVKYLLGSYEWKNDLDIKNVLLVSALEKLLLNEDDDELGTMKKRLPRLVTGDTRSWGGIVDGDFDNAYGFRCHTVHFHNDKRIVFSYLRDKLRPLVKKALAASLSLKLDHVKRIEKLNGLGKNSGTYATVDSYGWHS